jgi:hypothetical protein
MNRMRLSLQHLLRYADDGEDILNRNVTGTNHGCITTRTNPNQSVLQCNGNNPVHLQPKSSKFKVTLSAEKVMLIVFWNSKVVLLAHFQKRGEGVNSES